jgi:hypothetical protein
MNRTDQNCSRFELLVCGSQSCITPGRFQRVRRADTAAQFPFMPAGSEASAHDENSAPAMAMKVPVAPSP